MITSHFYEFNQEKNVFRLILSRHNRNKVKSGENKRTSCL